MKKDLQVSEVLDQSSLNIIHHNHVDMRERYINKQSPLKWQGKSQMPLILLPLDDKRLVFSE